MTDQTVTEQTTTFKPRDLYQEVTDTIIRQLESGTIPWQQTMEDYNNGLFMGLPFNGTTYRQYNGINIMLLWSATIENKFISSEWATFKQWADKKQSIRKGEKGTTIVYFDTFEKEVDGETQKIPFLKSSVVFNRCQLKGSEEVSYLSNMDMMHPRDKLDFAHSIAKGTEAQIMCGGSTSFYCRKTDTVYVASVDQFVANHKPHGVEAFYSTLFHELVHWSGSPDRLNRTKGKKFGDNEYAFEELVAELGAAFLCAEANMTTLARGDHTANINSWLKVLKNDKRFIVSAASEASKAAAYLKVLGTGNQ